MKTRISQNTLIKNFGPESLSGRWPSLHVSDIFIGFFRFERAPALPPAQAPEEAALVGRGEADGAAHARVETEVTTSPRVHRERLTEIQQRRDALDIAV